MTPPSTRTATSTAPGRNARTMTPPSGAGWGPGTAKGWSCSPATTAWMASGVRLMDICRVPATTKLEGADEALHPLVVALERVLAEDGLALGVVELQIDPVDAIVLALQVGLADELAAEASAGGLRRRVLGARDGLVGGGAGGGATAHEARLVAL